MSEFNTVNDVVQAAENLIASEKLDISNNKEFYDKLEKALEELPGEDGAFAPVIALLRLPDEQFKTIAPIFLSTIEKEYNNINNKLVIVQTLNAKGIYAEDVLTEYSEICTYIDKECLGILSAAKRDFLKEMLGITYNSIADTEGISKRTIQIPIEFCATDAKMPTYAHITDAGMDVYALSDIVIEPGETKLIPIGIKVAIPFGYELQVRPKSGRSLKSKLRIANTPGTIDAGYRDEIGIIVENIDNPIRDIIIDADGKVTSVLYGQNITIGKDEKIAQLVLSDTPKAAFVEVESVSQIGENRLGGFGSTGLK